MTDSVEERLANLEKKQSGRFWFVFQYLVAPGLLAAFGYSMTAIVNREQQELEQIQVAQTMVPALFSEDKHRALATKRLLDEVIIDPGLQASLDQIVADYMNTQAATAIENDDLETAKNILDAATAIGGSSGREIAQSFEAIPEAQEKLSKYEQARPHELAALEAVAENRFDVALAEMKRAETIYPTLHSVHEIRRLLEANEARFDEAETQAEIKEKIATQYRWKVPEETLSRIERR